MQTIKPDKIYNALAGSKRTLTPAIRNGNFFKYLSNHYIPLYFKGVLIHSSSVREYNFVAS
jgi:hypothetical protein